MSEIAFLNGLSLSNNIVKLKRDWFFLLSAKDVSAWWSQELD